MSFNSTQVNYKLLNKLNLSHSFLPSNDINELDNNIFYFIVFNLKSILKPVEVNYSAELLAQQIYAVSIILFIMSLLLIILFICFMINLIIFVYTDKILNYFTNKYIRLYVQFNKKIMGVEITIIGLTILYNLYMLSYGLHFISTHPIPNILN